MRKMMFTVVLLVILLSLVFFNTNRDSNLRRVQIDVDTQGVLEKVNNIYTTTIVSNDPNVYKAEYEAGFIQGKLQGDQIIAERDNEWDVAYLTDPLHLYPAQIPPSEAELSLAQTTLTANWEYTVNYIRVHADSDIGKKLRRLMYRLIGIYHGAVKENPASLLFDDQWYPTFSDEEMAVGYETTSLTFMDVYFVNTSLDLFDSLSDNEPESMMNQLGKCSAFVKRTQDDVFIAHNTWDGYLHQSQALTLWVNGDFMMVNIPMAGFLGAGADFGYTNNAILFLETTHHATYSEPEVHALWMFWRATLAEQFATSLDQFFNYVALEPSGTGMNGYMIVDAKTNEIGLVEMSYQSFVFFKIDPEGEIAVVTKPDGLDTTYDELLVQPDYLIGINFPASQQIRDDLQAQDTRPARKHQFLAQINSVNDMDSAKALIAYTDPQNPLSIFGRWDLGYGETPTPKTIPAGSIDAKVTSMSMIKDVLNLTGVLDVNSPVKGFWMKFGTPYVNGKPFIWSESQWTGWTLRLVPDRLDGDFTLLNTYIK